MKKIKIILVDDHQVVIDGMKAGFLLYQDIEVIAEANSGEELFDILNEKLPDIVILDISMPEISGIEVCEKIKQKYPAIKIIFFTGSETEDALFKTLKAGADGFLPKDTEREELVQAIYKVNTGENYISKKIPNTVLIDYLNKTKLTEQKETIPQLSERELEILELIASGLQYKTIAEKLFISPKTVEKHKRNIQKKLNLQTTIDLVKYAIKNKIIKI